jgi:hypothetical protein
MRRMPCFCRELPEIHPQFPDGRFGYGEVPAFHVLDHDSWVNCKGKCMMKPRDEGGVLD